MQEASLTIQKNNSNILSGWLNWTKKLILHLHDDIMMLAENWYQYCVVLCINMVVFCLCFQSLMAASCQQSNSSYLMGWRHADEASKYSHWLTLIHEAFILITHKNFFHGQTA